MNAPQNTSDPLSGKYLIFVINRIQYAINILKVKEIVGQQKTTPLPESPHYIKGIIHLQGNIVPVIDLKIRLGLPEGKSERSSIILLQKIRKDSSALFGIIVDAISNVAMLSSEDIEDIGAIGPHLKESYILGVSKGTGQEAIILDIEALLYAREIPTPQKRL